MRRHDGQLVERLAAVVAEAADTGQHGLHDGRGHGVARRRERLGDEERVAARDAVDRLGVGAGAGGQPPHSLPRQRDELEPVHRAAREHAEQALERVAGIDLVVAVREHQQSAGRLDPARGVREDVERRVVRPVQVLDHEHGRRLGRQLLQQRGEDVLDRLVVGERGGQRAVAPKRRVAKRAERPRRHQVVAGGEQDPGVLTASRANARIRLVFPMPASPVTTATDP